jgi:hypothetical protein
MQSLIDRLVNVQIPSSHPAIHVPSAGQLPEKPVAPVVVIPAPAPEIQRSNIVAVPDITPDAPKSSKALPLVF